MFDDKEKDIIETEDDCCCEDGCDCCDDDCDCCDDNIVVLTDELGNESEFEFLDLIEYDGEEYCVLLPCDEGDEANEVVILQLVCEDDNEETEEYVAVESAEILSAVFEIFKKNQAENFNFAE